MTINAHSTAIIGTLLLTAGIGLVHGVQGALITAGICLLFIAAVLGMFQDTK